MQKQWLCMQLHCILYILSVKNWGEHRFTRTCRFTPYNLHATAFISWKFHKAYWANSYKTVHRTVCSLTVHSSVDRLSLIYNVVFKGESEISIMSQLSSSVCQLTVGRGKNHWIVVSRPCDNLEAVLRPPKPMWILQQNWTCRETGLRRYECRSASQFRTRSRDSPTKP